MILFRFIANAKPGGSTPGKVDFYDFLHALDIAIFSLLSSLLASLLVLGKAFVLSNPTFMALVPVIGFAGDYVTRFLADNKPGSGQGFKP